MKNLLNKIGAYLTETNGVKSFVRFASATTILTSLAWGTTEVIVCIFVKDYQTHTELILGTLAIGFSGKVLQKKHEPNERETNDTGG